jgi:hypothetical protein
MAHPPNNDNLQTYKIVVVGDGGGKFYVSFVFLIELERFK